MGRTHVHVLLAVIVSQGRTHHVFCRLSHLVRIKEFVQASSETERAVLFDDTREIYKTPECI